MSDKEIARAILAMADVFGHQMSKDSLTLYVSTLRGFEHNEVLAAIRRATSESEFMPRPQTVLAILESRTNRDALRAWEILTHAIRAIGHVHTPKFGDGRLNNYVRMMGGWSAVCRWMEDELHWRRREFLSQYDDLPEEEWQSAIPRLEALPNGSELRIPTPGSSYGSVGSTTPERARIAGSPTGERGQNGSETSKA